MDGQRTCSGWAGWLLARWNGRRRVEPRLALVERITLAPRQSLALIEAEGRRILVATSAEGGPAFYPLDETSELQDTRGRQRRTARPDGRGSHGRRPVAAHGRSGSGGGASFARPECETAALGRDAVDDSPGSDADHVAAGDPDGDDAAGASADRLSLPAPGAGHADRALESHADGAGADDGLVPDDAGAEPGGSAGRRALSQRPDHGHWRPSTAARSRSSFSC